MVSIKRELLLGISIPTIFTIGVIAFFNLIPSESQTLSNFIGYTSSLATILMVLVVIVTTSLQLKEMQSSKLLQTQPFPSITPLDGSYIEELAFFYDVPESKTKLMRRMFFRIEVENIGNAPIIAIDIVPKLGYSDDEDKEVIVETVWERIDSLKPNRKEKIELMFVPEGKCDMAECFMKKFLNQRFAVGHIELVVLYRNLLGAAFRLRMFYDIFLYEEDREKIKSCLKLSQAAKIDYAKEMNTINSLKSDVAKRHEILKKINDELSKKDGHERIGFEAEPRHDLFSVTSMSEKEYNKQMQTQKFGRRVFALKSRRKRRTVS